MLFSHIVCHLGSKFSGREVSTFSLGRIFHPRFQIFRHCPERTEDTRDGLCILCKYPWPSARDVCPLEQDKKSASVLPRKRAYFAMQAAQRESQNGIPTLLLREMRFYFLSSNLAHEIE